VRDISDAATRPWRLVALISGAGRTLQNLIDVIGRGELHAEIVGVVSSRADVLGVAIARNAGIPVRVVLPRNFESRQEYSAAKYVAISKFNPDLVILAGYLRQLDMPEAWETRVLNIHPSLLPETLEYAAGKGKYGIHVHRAVLEHGDTVSGATVHVVEAAYDSGPPLLKAEVPVLPGDTPEALADRVFETEKWLYPEAIRQYMSANPHLLRDYESSRR
jgi:phosphoribosylglycinamide formyltransferase-1